MSEILYDHAAVKAEHIKELGDVEYYNDKIGKWQTIIYLNLWVPVTRYRCNGVESKRIDDDE